MDGFDILSEAVDAPPNNDIIGQTLEILGVEYTIVRAGWSDQYVNLEADVGPTLCRPVGLVRKALWTP